VRVGQVPADPILVAVALDHEQVIEQHEAVQRRHGKFGAHRDDAEGDVGQIHRHQAVELAEHRRFRAGRHMKRCLAEHELKLLLRLVQDLLALDPGCHRCVNIDVAVDRRYLACDATGISARLKQAGDDRHLEVSDADRRSGQFVKLLLDGCLTAFPESPAPTSVTFLNLAKHGDQFVSHVGMTGCLGPCPDVIGRRYLVAVLNLGDFRACPAERFCQLHGFQPGSRPQTCEAFGKSSGGRELFTGWAHSSSYIETASTVVARSTARTRHLWCLRISAASVTSILLGASPPS
jgi:hypothetical protein